MTSPQQEDGYCNWSFDECLVQDRKWLVRKDCVGEITLSRGDSRNWKAYEASLQPHLQFIHPPGDKCPNCGKHVNGVNPYDNGETWRR